MKDFINITVHLKKKHAAHNNDMKNHVLFVVFIVLKIKKKLLLFRVTVSKV